MKKLLLISLVLLVLTGCSYISFKSLPDNLDEYLANLDYAFEMRPNHAVKYYEYYLPSDTREIDGDDNSAVIEYENSKAVMNLNISSIINNIYFSNKVMNDDGFFKDATLIYENNGGFKKDKDAYSSYYLKVYQANNNQYLLHLATGDVNFYGTTNQKELTSFVKHLFTIAKSVNVNKDSVIADYSNKDVIEYEKKQVDLFEYIIPSSGFLSDLINTNNATTSSSEGDSNSQNNIEILPEE